MRFATTRTFATTRPIVIVRTFATTRVFDMARVFAVVFVTLIAVAGCGGGDGTAPPITADPTSSEAVVAPPTASPVTTDPASGSVPIGVVETEDLRQLSFEYNGDRIELLNGEAYTYVDGVRDSNLVLQDPVARGDLDSDGDDDLVAHVIDFTTGTGTLHLIVPVIDDAGTAKALRPVFVGDRVIVEEVTIREGVIEVTLFDRADDEPFTVITLRKTLEIDSSGSEPSVRVIDEIPIENLPLPGQPEEIVVRFEPGAIGTTISGTIEFRHLQSYIVRAMAKQRFVVELDAPPGVWLDVRLDEQVLVSGAERTQRLETDLPASGPWKVNVTSAHRGPADYRLTIEALPLGTEVPPLQNEPAPTLPPPTLAEPTPPSNASTPGVIHLTFDDGPHPVYTPRILEVLDRFGARATFFVLGSLAEKYPELLTTITDAGHTLANHTWNHENLAVLSRTLFDETVGRTQAVLGPRATPCLRPPYGTTDDSTKQWAAEHGLDIVFWTVDTGDWRRPGSLSIANKIINGARNGANVLLHDGGGNRSQTVRALELALPRLSELYRFEPLCHPSSATNP